MNAFVYVGNIHMYMCSSISIQSYINAYVVSRVILKCKKKFRISYSLMCSGCVYKACSLHQDSSRYKSSTIFFKIAHVKATIR